MESRVNYVLVGLFVTVFGAVTVLIILWLGVGSPQANYTPYYTYLRESVSGLNVKAPVKYSGVDVGYVEEISLVPNDVEQVRVKLMLVKDTPVKTDTIATLALTGLTGLSYVSLVGSSNDAPLLTKTSGSDHPVIPSQLSLLARLDSVLVTVLSSMSTLSDALSGFASITDTFGTDERNAIKTLLTNSAETSEELKLWLGKENRESFQQTLAEMKVFSRTLAENSQRIEGLVVDIRKGSSEFANVASNMPEVLTSIKAAADRVNAAADSWVEVGGDSKTLVAETQASVGGLNAQVMPQLVGLLNDLRLLSDSLSQLTESIRRQPSRVIYGNQSQPKGPGE